MAIVLYMALLILLYLVHYKRRSVHICQINENLRWFKVAMVHEATIFTDDWIDLKGTSVVPLGLFFKKRQSTLVVICVESVMAQNAYIKKIRIKVTLHCRSLMEI